MLAVKFMTDMSNNEQIGDQGVNVFSPVIKFDLRSGRKDKIDTK